jgi:phosphopantetheinyl transferase
MPLFYQQDINDTTKLAIWKIEESEAFFAGTIPIQSTITHKHKRLQHLAGRFLLRYLFPSFPYHEIEIAQTRKPFLPNEQFHFSISHCGDYAAAIVSTTNRVGVDVELATERVLKIAHKFLHAEEISNFTTNQSSNQPINQSTNPPINPIVELQRSHF